MYRLDGVAMKFPSLRAWLLSLAALISLPAFAQDDGLLPVTQAFHLTADASKPGVVKLHWAIAPNYYLYRGQLKIKATDEAALKLGEPQLPAGKKHHDEFLGDVETYHGAMDATLPYTLTDASAKTIALTVRYQGCHEIEPKICYPPNTEKLTLTIGAPPVETSPAAPADSSAGTAPAATGASPSDSGLALLGGKTAAGPADGSPLPAEKAFRFEAIATAPDKLLLRWTMPKDYYLYRDKTALEVISPKGASLGEPEWPSGIAHNDKYNGDAIVYYDQVELPVALKDSPGKGDVVVQATFQGCLENGICYPVMTRQVKLDLSGTGTDVTPAANLAAGAAGSATSASARPEVAPQMPPPGAGDSPGLLAVLGLALLGGLILNLMPCVLPVLSLKVVSVVEGSGHEGGTRKHALYYTAGVLVSFAAIGLAVIGLRAAGHALGWGFQLQQPVAIAVLIYIMLAVGLSMSGVVQFGTSLGNTGNSLASRSGPTGDFFTGVLAVVVASPCTAPFMGPALAFAFAASPLVALLVFLLLGLGLALPFLAIGYIPALARLLPRPGRWMETFKQVLAFPMYLTAVWLVWVLANQRGANAVGAVLAGAVVLAAALWWFERSRGGKPLSKVFVAVLALGALYPLLVINALERPQAAAASSGRVTFSPEKLAELRNSGKPVFVDMGADWCVTCKANEHAVLDTDAFRAVLKETGATYMYGDWTDVNPTIAAFLEQHRSPGVPLYVVYPGNGAEGKKLSTVLTQDAVATALREAAAP
jgi:thiol:disulfide interchange protein